MNEQLERLRPLVGILGGALVGGTLYAFLRGALPGQLAFGSAVVGVLAGLGARAFGAIGSPGQLRVLIFATLFATVIGEYSVFYGLPAGVSFAAWLLADPLWLVLTVLFLVAGIFFGVRLLVGMDAWRDVLEHGSAAVPPGAAGTQCPRCSSLQTMPQKSGLLCAACDHRFSAAPRSVGGADRGS